MAADADGNSGGDPSERLGSATLALADRLGADLPAWIVRRVDALLDAWGGVPPGSRDALRSEAAAAGAEAGARVAAAVAGLAAEPVLRQATTPMQIVRSCHLEPTELLGRAGVPPVVRDPFDERALPGDVYGLAPRTAADLGDRVAALHLAWGVAKVTAVSAARAAG